MPNHVQNEVILTGFEAAGVTKEDVLAAIAKDGEVNFQILLPVPLNYWQGDVGSQHEDHFPGTGLKWATENWGSRWNAYQHQPIEDGPDRITLRFKTAWSPPMGWLVAVFNRFQKLEIVYHWLCEGEDHARTGLFLPERPEKGPWEGRMQWSEEQANGGVLSRLRKLLYGEHAGASLD